MIIAIATTRNNVDEFRSCSEFQIYTIDPKEKKILEKSTIKAEKCHYIVGKVFQLIDAKVTTLFVKRLESPDALVLKNAGIKVLKGHSGRAEKVVVEWLAG
jgi:predicted Fe-Mo cluster-binding NifX family protein